jgi:UDP-2,4-diacetamido-2,4,6-trideoxy-beta-L-altropyranose hydrolase
MRLFIRADADPTIGTGHVMRCLALGQAWRDAGGEVVFSTACEPPELRARLRSEGLLIHPPNALEDFGENGCWLVLDGYQFEAEDQRRARYGGRRVLAIDDMAQLPRYYADVVLNQNIGAERSQYSCEPYTRLLLGPSYALLRREFIPWSNHHREIPTVARKLLVTLGGSDPHNVTARVIQAVRSISIDGLETVVVAGAQCGMPFELLGKASDAGVRLERNVTDMAPLMAWADLAVSGAGSTCWEMAFLGLPAIVIALAENQCGIASGLAEHGCAVSLGWHAEVTAQYVATAIRNLVFDQERRREMSERGSCLVDGAGAKRVVEILRN